MTARLPESVRFQDTDLTIIDHGGAPWLTGNQIGYALGCKDPAQNISNIYRRHAEEFTDAMTATIRQSRSRVRIFSPRGCHLIAMFARTERAKAFRRWVLDVLEGVVPAPAPASPSPYPAWARPAILAHLIRRLRDPHPMDTWGQTSVKAEIAAELARLVDAPETDGPDNRTRRAELNPALDDTLERFHAPAPGGAPAPADPVMTGAGVADRPAAGLTKAQYHALCVIEELTEAAGYAPSIREIAHEMDMVVSGAHALVERLHERGWIAVPPARARGVRVLRRPVMPDFAALEAAGWALTEAGIAAALRKQREARA